jgi:hypothetical protein
MGPEKMEWLKQRMAHVGYKKCRRLVWLSWQSKVSTEHQLNHILEQESRKEKKKILLIQQRNRPGLCRYRYMRSP